MMLLKICIASTLLISAVGYAREIGNTYPIVEESLLDVMNERMRKLQLSSVDLRKMSAFKGVPLPANAREDIRTFTPFYTLEFDLIGKTGEVIYPKGYVFNPAAHSRLPNTLLVFSDAQIAFAKANALPTDVLLLTQGDIASISKEFDRPVYYLEQAMVKRFDLRGTPTRVSQVGAQYEVKEMVARDE